MHKTPVLFVLLVSAIGQIPPKFPNIGYIGQGYDLLYGNPQSMQAASDPGFRAGVFDLTYSGQMTADGKYRIPDGTEVRSCPVCGWEFSVDQMSGVQAYSESVSGSIGFGFKGVTMKFGFSSSYQYMLNTQSTEGHLYTKALAACSVYCALVQTYTPPNFTTNFVQGVKAIPLILDNNANLQWIGEFGTHVLQKVNMGGIFGQQTEFDRASWASLLTEEQMSGFSIGLSAKYSAIELAGGTSTLSKDQQSQSQLFRSMAYRQSQIMFGGAPPPDGNVSAWEDSVTEKPMPIEYTLLDITSLLTPSYFPTISPADLATKQANLQSTISNYCQLLLAQGMGSTCEPPEDPGFPPPATACYKKTAQYGGSGGSIFDSGAPKTNSSQVKTIRVDVRCSDYLEWIQFTVDDGISSWPMKGQGDAGGGSAKVFIVPTGDWISRVILWSYQDINAIQFATAGGTQSEICGNPYKQQTTQYILDFNVTAKQNPVSVFGRGDHWIDALGFYLENPC